MSERTSDSTLVINSVSAERGRDLLYNLLAVIHRDGGHYTGEHGLEQAAIDAEKAVLADRERAETAEGTVILRDIEISAVTAAAQLKEEKLTADLARVQAQSAARREALIEAKHCLNGAANDPLDKPVRFIDSALSSDAGRNFVPAEKVKSLIEMLTNLCDASQFLAHESGSRPFLTTWQKAREALATAHDLLPSSNEKPAA